MIYHNGIKLFSDEELLGDGSTIVNIEELEQRLQDLYLELAVQNNKEEVLIYSDYNEVREYEKIKKSGGLFHSDSFYLLMDENHEKILDFAPVIFRLLDAECPEAIFYTKLKKFEGHLQS